MFEKFTEGARKIIVLAQQEAHKLKHAYSGTEHLLLGMLQQENEIAFNVLNEAGIDYAKALSILEEILGVGDAIDGSHIPFTPRAKTVLEYAVRESSDSGAAYVGSEHLLLGLIKEGEGIATQILYKAGIDLRDLKSIIYDGLNIGKDGGPELVGTVPNSKREKGSMLEKFGRSLTKLANQGKLDPVVGREVEIERIMQILARRTKNNPILLGDPGVGKTAVVEGLAQRIVSGNVPEPLKGKNIYSLDLGLIVGGTRYRGDFEERMKKIINEVQTSGNTILFIDEIHTLIGAGNAEGSMDAANMIKPMLARGELQTIGATTQDEYRRYFEKDSALERRFQPVNVPEPTFEESVEILRGLKPEYEKHHNITITEDAIQSAVQLSSRYLTDRFLPDKAIDLIDESGARLRIKSLNKPAEIIEIDEAIAQNELEKTAAIDAQDFEKAASIRDTEGKLKDARKNLEDKWQQDLENNKPELTGDTIAEVLSMSTGIPVYKLTIEESKRLLNMEEELHKRIIGQDEAVKAISKAIRRSRSGLKDPKRPGGSFIFAGSTGVGKTELAKTLAEYLFGDEDSLIQIDMSEFAEKYSVSKLFGTSPGFVGYDDGGQLTEKVRRNPYSVILFDEVEKAHPDVFNSLLQVLEEGRLTDGKGRVVNFKNTIIILTTNLGTREVSNGLSVGFNADIDAKTNYQRMKDKVMTELKHNFRPEFLNRVDDTIVFEQLNREQITQILDLQLQKVQKMMQEQDMDLFVSLAAKELLIEKGFDPAMGARPLRRTVQREIEDYISERLLYGDYLPGQTIRIDVDSKQQFTFTPELTSTNEEKTLKSPVKL